MTVEITLTVANLRKTYLPGRTKTGNINVNLSCYGKPVSRLAFARHNVVRYYGPDGNCIAVFQDNCCLDD